MQKCGCSTDKLSGLHCTPVCIYIRIMRVSQFRRIGRRATDVKNGNAGPKLHWRLWEKGCFPDLAGERYFSEENEGHGGDIWAKTKLFLAYCL